MLGLHQECLGVVKIVMELHRMSQGGKQREFRDGGGNVWAHHVSSGGDQGKFLRGEASAWASP